MGFGHDKKYIFGFGRLFLCVCVCGGGGGEGCRRSVILQCTNQKEHYLQNGEGLTNSQNIKYTFYFI